MGFVRVEYLAHQAPTFVTHINQFIYLRTRWAFGLKAGGSVAHTAGVINSLAGKYPLQIISNDELPEVIPPYRIIQAFKPKWLPVLISETIYNVYLWLKLPKPKQGTAIYQRLSAYSFLGAFWADKGTPFILEYNGSEAWGLKNWSKLYNTDTLSGWLMDFYKRRIEIPYVSLIENYNLRKAKLIVVVSDELKRQLVVRNIAEHKIISYPNGVDPEKFKPGLDGSSVRKKYNVGEATIFGFIGSFGQWHGTDILAQAIVQFYGEHPEMMNKVKFLLIGDGMMMSDVKHILEPLQNPQDVVLTGNVEQHLAPLYLSACDVLLSPHKSNPDGTKFFGSPTKLFEYMAMGKPIIASDLEQIGDVLQHMQSAYLIPPDQPALLSDAFDNFIEKSEMMKDLGVEARRVVMATYTWDIHVDQILRKL